MSSTFQIVRSHGGNWITASCASLHAKLHFRKIDISSEDNLSSFIQSLNKTNRIGGSIGLIVSLLGAAALIVTFYFTGSTLPLIAGLPFIPFIILLSLNSLINRLKNEETTQSSVKSTPDAKSPTPKATTEEKKIEAIQEQPNVLTASSSSKVDPHKLDARNQAFVQLVQALNSKQPDNPLDQSFENLSKLIYVESNQRTFQFSGLGIDLETDQLNSLLAALEKDTYYDSILLEKASLTDSNTASIIKLIEAKNLQNLDLNRNEITKVGLTELISNLCEKSLKMENLNLRHNKIGCLHSELLTIFNNNHLKPAHIQNLQLGDNQLEETQKKATNTMDTKGRTVLSKIFKINDNTLIYF